MTHNLRQPGNMFLSFFGLLQLTPQASLVWMVISPRFVRKLQKSSVFFKSTSLKKNKCPFSLCICKYVPIYMYVYCLVYDVYNTYIHKYIYIWEYYIYMIILYISIYNYIYVYTNIFKYLCIYTYIYILYRYTMIHPYYTMQQHFLQPTAPGAPEAWATHQ